MFFYSLLDKETSIIRNGVQKEKENLMEPVTTDSELIVLSEINLSVEKGNVYGICGRIGSGKSSLISSILGEVSHNVLF